MKKIDLHIHTSSSIYEESMDFSLEKMKEYVSINKLDIIAITNHNHFDKEQFELIDETLDCVVYPGVEIDIESSHLLVIVSQDQIDELETACSNLYSKIKSPNDSVTFEEFANIFPNYENYILIPHVKKEPSIKTTTLEKFGNIIKTGEVQSAKKFESAKKDIQSLVPVYFSDVRIKEDIDGFPVRYTYLDINSTEFGVIKTALSDKDKVFLSENKKSDEFAFLSDGTSASTKLNVVIGKRSSGKTYNLNQIHNSGENNNIKFVKQFSLTGQSEEKSFNELIKQEQETIIHEYLNPLRDLVDTMLDIDDSADRQVDSYLKSLKEHATNQSLQDAYSKAKLFNETEYSFLDSRDTKKVIEAIITLLESRDNKEIIDKYISKENMIGLLNELIIQRNKELLEFKLKQETDKIVKLIKPKLTSKSSMVSISEVNMFNVQKDRIMKAKFNKLCNSLKQAKEVYNLDVYRFKLSIERIAYRNAQDVKTNLKGNPSIANTFNNCYDSPFTYIHNLLNDGVQKSDIYKALINFKVKVVNEKNNELSGGERAEYNLLREIKSSEQYDVLLLDEPEASFDNPFIKDYIIDIIKDISQKTTVFITTHNNSLGILLKPNKLIYTSNEEDGFKVYTGEFCSKTLTTANGDSIISYDTVMEVMEAGTQAYEERKQIYESFKN